MLKTVHNTTVMKQFYCEKLEFLHKAGIPYFPPKKNWFHSVLTEKNGKQFRQ